MSRKGEIYCNWTIIQKADFRGNNTYYLCNCICGTIREVSWTNLRKGTSKSCGCLKINKNEIEKIKNKVGRPIKLKEIDLTGLKKQFEYAKLRQSILDSGDPERIGLMLAAEQSKLTSEGLEDAQG